MVPQPMSLERCEQNINGSSFCTLVLDCLGRGLADLAHATAGGRTTIPPNRLCDADAQHTTEHKPPEFMFITHAVQRSDCALEQVTLSRQAPCTQLASTARATSGCPMFQTLQLLKRRSWALCAQHKDGDAVPRHALQQ
jgi:hypothetical protein